MVRKKKSEQQNNEIAVGIVDKKIVEGSHSRFIFNTDGSFEHYIDWNKLGEEINQAIADYDKHKPITKTETEAVSHSGTETGEVFKTVKKAKAKKVSK